MVVTRGLHHNKSTVALLLGVRKVPGCPEVILVPVFPLQAGWGSVSEKGDGITAHSWYGIMRI